MGYRRKKEKKRRPNLMRTVNLCEKLAGFFPLKIHVGILLNVLVCVCLRTLCVFSFSLDNNNINIFFRMFSPGAWQNVRQLEVTQSEDPLGCLQATYPSRSQCYCFPSIMLVLFCFFLFKPVLDCRTLNWKLNISNSNSKLSFLMLNTCGYHLRRLSS